MTPAVFCAQFEHKKWKASQIRIQCSQMKLEIWNLKSPGCKWQKKKKKTNQKQSPFIYEDSFVHQQIIGKIFTDEIWKTIAENNCLMHVYLSSNAYI